MYDAVRDTSAAPARSASFIPIAAICCLATIALAIAAAIVLALIPVYLPARKVTPVTTSPDDDTFLLEYSTTSVGADSSVAGTVNNLNDVQSALGLGNDVKLTSGSAKATYQRRRRSLLNRRQRRAIGMSFVFKCQYNFPVGCVGSCKQKRKTIINTGITSITSFSNIQIQVAYGSAVVSFSVSLSLSGLIQQTALPSGYGVVTSTSFVAVTSGSIFSPATWLGGVVPFRGCGVTVAVGVSLSIAAPNLIIPLASINVVAGATLSLGLPGTAGFSFATTIAISISGTFSFVGSGGVIALPPGSAFSFLPGAVFVGTSVTLQIVGTSISIVISTTTTAFSLTPNGSGGYITSTSAPGTTASVTTAGSTTASVTTARSTTASVTANVAG